MMELSENPMAIAALVRLSLTLVASITLATFGTLWRCRRYKSTDHRCLRLANRALYLQRARAQESFQ
jgi:hypothetical protein